MSRARLTQLLNDLSASTALAPLSRVILSLAEQAFRNQDILYPRPGSETLRAVPTLPPELSNAGAADIAAVIERGATSFDELEVLGAMTLVGVTREDSNRVPDLVRALLWLESFSGLHCLSLAPAVYDGPRLQQLGSVLLDLLEKAEVSPTEQRIAKAWLSACSLPECAQAAARARDWVVEDAATKVSVQGQLGPRPHSALGWTVMALTGLLFLNRFGVAMGRLVLMRRSPATFWLSERGLELVVRHEMLGRRLKERRILLPIDTIRSVEREVRFPRLGLYAGLTALTLGTLLGTRLFVDGLRVAGLSFPLLAMGLGLVLVGILLDMALSGAGESLRGRCRVVIKTRRGPGWSIGDLEAQRVDPLLTELSGRLSAQRG